MSSFQVGEFYQMFAEKRAQGDQICIAMMMNFGTKIPSKLDSKEV